MRNLAVFCDGTWNTPDMTDAGTPSPTNVVKLYNLCVEDAGQLRYYHPGVGNEGGPLRRALGGGLGTGLDAIIQSAYQWLCSEYRPDDRIFLFGFSRGAYTARSLGGFILRCGMLDLTGLSPADRWSRVATAFAEGYRKDRPSADWGPGWPKHKDTQARDPDIHFIGVWDTVGARGVPDDMVALDLVLDDPSRYSFHDTRLRPGVHHAYHAVALDEPRASFAPTLWTLDDEPRPAGTSFSQVWFPGCHSDVGGGFGWCGLADGALKWMADHAKAQGLSLDPDLLAQVQPNPRCVLHDPLQGVWKLLRTLPRATPELCAQGVGKSLHQSAWDRHQLPPIAQAPYRPIRRLAPGESWSGNIYAREHWNDTGVWLEPGASYRLEATGEWIDLYNKSGPEGLPDGRFEMGDLVYRLGDLLGLGEKAYQQLTGKSGADWWATRRLESAPWFSLVGMVANQADVDGSGTPPVGQMLAIGRGLDVGKGTAVELDRSGYLYCFANDAWRFYGNNKGSVRLTLSRT